ncbi:acyl carrier protein [Actinokineospora baliensis]|uniref:phosphopantetheine-binding protein n=1 Tax=Actinokineospora baliensis TaxID=547056 RepID=UPI00195BB7A4|nr:phosphopantetheine-binding protein [Actinokineospora baliensis]MBM7775496.1 acyl carrier protein [Actinokineospora baliensis]
MEDDLSNSIRAIWEDALKLDRIGFADSFADLGGHSLAAMRIVARTRAQFGVRVSVRELFDQPTVAGFADAVRRLLPATQVK